MRTHTVVSEALGDLEVNGAGLLLVDLNLEAANGLEVAREALEQDPDVAIIMMTGQGSEAIVVQCLRLGISDYLMKPFEMDELGRSVQRALLRRSTDLRRFSNEELLRQRITELQSERRTTALSALGEIVWSYEAKHPFLRGHSLRVADVAAAIGQELGLPKSGVERLRIAGLLHDVGMIAVPDTAMLHAGRLDSHDLQKVRSHPTLGGDLVRAFGLDEAASFIESHHERLDGSGYPLALKGSELPAGAMILGLAEVFAALTEARPFREAGSPENAIDTLRGVAGMWFPSAMINALECARPWASSRPIDMVENFPLTPAAYLKLA